MCTGPQTIVGAGPISCVSSRLSIDRYGFGEVAVDTIPVHPFLGLVIQVAAVDPVELKEKFRTFMVENSLIKEVEPVGIAECIKCRE